MKEDELQRLARIKQNLELRALIFECTRAFFRNLGFLEVDTPIRLPAVAPEQHIAPFESEDWFLATSPELHMKRLLAAGYEKLFQISHCFRKGERGRYHNPEFAMLEWYRAGADYLQMINDTEQLLITLARKLGKGSIIGYQNQKIDLTPPWPKITVRDAFLQAADWDPVARFDPERFDLDLVSRVVPRFPPGRPAVLLDYPAAAASLSRLKPGHPEVAERAEVFLGGLELANAYSELTDAREQEKRFLEEIAEIKKDKTRKAAMPQNFIDAVSHLPECGGIALGMDRLVMLFADASSIEEVMPFTADNA